MSSLEIITREINQLDLPELWLVLEKIQAQIKENTLTPKPTEKRLRWDDFSFNKARAGTANTEVNLAEAVIEERRSYL